MMPLSALFGGIAGGPCIEYLGRRNTILATALPFIAGTVTILFIPDFRDREYRDADFYAFTGNSGNVCNAKGYTKRSFAQRSSV